MLGNFPTVLDAALLLRRCVDWSAGVVLHGQIAEDVDEAISLGKLDVELKESPAVLHSSRIASAQVDPHVVVVVTHMTGVEKAVVLAA